MGFILCKHCQTIIKEGNTFDCQENICPLEQFEFIDEMTVQELTKGSDNRAAFSSEGGAAPSDSPKRIQMYEK